MLLLMVLPRPACQILQPAPGLWLFPASLHWLFWPRSIWVPVGVHMLPIAASSSGYSPTDEDIVGCSSIAASGTAVKCPLQCVACGG